MQNKKYADKLEPMIKKITDQIGKLTLVTNAGRSGRRRAASFERGPVAQARPARAIPKSTPTSRTSARSAIRITSKPT